VEIFGFSKILVGDKQKKWYLFNDFTIVPQKKYVLSFKKTWKVIIVYVIL